MTQRLSEFVKDVRTIAGIVAGIVAGLSSAAFSGVASVDAAQVRAISDRVTQVEADVEALSETLGRRDRYAFCRWQAEDSGLEPSICNQILPDNFLPARSP